MPTFVEAANRRDLLGCILDRAPLNLLLDLERGEHRLGRNEEVVTDVEKDGREVPVVDQEVDLLAAVPVGVNGKALGHPVATGED